ncbi:MAG: CHAT domain-containing protein [Elusimicrobia bacterium]|nr:CHAT domain-containing protein [Elusimicrobiota bacterium]
MTCLLALVLAMPAIAAEPAADISCAEARAHERDYYAALPGIVGKFEEAQKRGDQRALMALGREAGDLGWLLHDETKYAYENYGAARLAAHALGDRRTEADVVGNMARIEVLRGNFEAAAQLYEDSAAFASDAMGRARFLRSGADLKKAADRMREGDYRGVIAALMPSLDEARRNGAHRDIQVYSRKIGEVYWLLLDDPAKAYELYTEARGAAHACGGGRTEAEIIRNLALLSVFFGRYAKAARLYEDATAPLVLDAWGHRTIMDMPGQRYQRLSGMLRQRLSATAGESRGPRHGAALNDEAKAALKTAEERMRTQDFRGAVAVLVPALEDARKTRDRASVEILSRRIGDLYWEPVPEKALEFYDEAGAAAHALGDRKTALEIADKLAARAIGHLGEPAGAELYEEAAAIAPDEAARKRYVRLSATLKILRNLVDYTRYRDIVGILMPAIQEARRTGDFKSLQVLCAFVAPIRWHYLGDAAAAYNLLIEARTAAHALGDRNAEAAATHNLAYFAGWSGDMARSRELAEEAATLTLDEAARKQYEQTGALAMQWLDQAEGDESELAAKAYPFGLPLDSSLANELLRQGDTKTARSIFERMGVQLPSSRARAREREGDYKQASLLYRQDWEAMERRRAGPDERGKEAYVSWTTWGLEAIEGLVRVSSDEDAFYYAETARARILTKSLGERRSAEVAPLAPESSKRETALQARQAEYERRRDSARELSRGRIDVDRFAGAADRSLDRDREEFLTELRRTRPDYAAAHYPEPLHAADIPLRQDEVLLEYAVTEPSTKVFVVKGGKVAAARTIPISRRELVRLVRRFRAFFDGVERSRDLARFDASVGLRLADLLLRPVLGHIPPGSKVVISPDGVLDLLPFEALVLSTSGPVQMPAGRYGPAPAGVRYAGDDYDIAYTPSGTALASQRLLRRRTRSPEEIFVVADPIFGPSDPRWRGGIPRSAFQAEVQSSVLKSMGLGGKRSGLSGTKTTASEAGFPRLDKTSLLAESLRNDIFGQKSTLVLQGPEATEARVKTADLSRYRYLVFATHGILDGDVPYLKEPALVLGQMDAGGEDGFLTMGEVAQLKLNADLVALTACQTGVGRPIPGEGTLGLVRAFQLAGADSVLVSLWGVAEDSTTDLARVFFAGLKQGLPPRTALRKARAEVRRQGYEHPFYWAPFILVTD